MANSGSIVEKIDTAVVRNVANNLKVLNSQMKTGFEDVQTSILELEASWQGDAANHAIGSFDKIKELSLSRYDVMNSYVNFLLLYIGEGYEDSEKKNKSIADTFK